MNPSRRLGKLIAWATIVLFASSAASAAVLTWDAETGTTEAQNGSGTWINGGTNWWDGAQQTWNNANKDTAVFGTGVSITPTYTVTVDTAGVTAGGMTVNYSGAGSYKITGGPLTFSAVSGTPTILFNFKPSGGFTIESNINVTGDLLVDSGVYGGSLSLGSATLGTTNSWTGVLHHTISAANLGGSVGFLNPGALGGSLEGDAAGTCFSFAANATFSLPSDKSITIRGWGSGTSGLHSIRGAIIGGSGTTTAAVLDAHIILADNSAICSSNSTTAGTFTLKGPISETGGPRKLTVTGAQTLILQGSSTYTGDTDIYRGSLTLDCLSGAAIYSSLGEGVHPYLTFGSTETNNTSGSVVLNINKNEQIGDGAVVRWINNGNTGTMNLLGYTETVMGLYKDSSATGTGIVQNQGVSSDSLGTLVLNTAGSNFSYNGTIRDSSVTDGTKGKLTLTKKGLGTQTLDGANSGLFTGGVNIEGGTLAVGASGPTSFASPLINVSGGTLDVSLQPAFALTAAQALVGNGTVAGLAQNLAGSKISGGTLGAAGTLTLNNSFTGVQDGIWQFDLSDSTSSGNDLISVVGDLALNDGAIVEINMTEGLLTNGDYPLFSYTGNFTGNLGSVAITGSAGQGTRSTTSLQQSAPCINLHVDYVAPFSLTWAGTSGANTWDINTSQNWTNGSPQYFFNLDNVTFNNSGYNNVALSGTLIPGSITIASGTTQDYTFSGDGTLTGSAGIAKNGSGKLTIANAGGYELTGAIALNEGTLAFQRGDTTITNIISGSGSLRQEGVGILTVSGDNSAFTGSVAVVNGTLRVGSTTALGTAAGSTTVNGGTLDLYGADLGDELVIAQGSGFVGLGAIVNNGAPGGGLKNLTLNAATTLGGSANWNILPGGAVTTNGNNLEKIDPNTVTLNSLGAVSFGNIAINGGRLTLAGTSDLGTTGITVSGGGELGLASASSIMPANGVTVAADDNGGIALESGTLAWNAPIVIQGAGTLNMRALSGASLTVNNANLTYSATAGLANYGTGTVHLAGNFTYEGDTTVRNGRLTLDAGTTLNGDVVLDPEDSSTTRTLEFKSDDQLLAHDHHAIIYMTPHAGNQLILNNTSQKIGGLDFVTGGDSSSNIFNGSTAGPATLVLDVNDGESYAYRGVIRDTSGGASTDPNAQLTLVKRGSGTQIIGSTKSGQYTGGLIVEAGTLDFVNFVYVDPETGIPEYSPGALPNCNITVTGGTLVTPSKSILDPTLPWTIKTFQITGGTVGGDGVLQSNAAYDVRGGLIDVVLAGTQGLIKTNAVPGTSSAVTLNKANTYTGPTEIKEGSLVLGSGGSIKYTPSITVSQGAVFNVSNLYSFTLGESSFQTLAGAGAVTGNTLVYSGTISPGTSTAPGTLTFNGNLDLSYPDNMTTPSLEYHLTPSTTGTNDLIDVNGVFTQPQNDAWPMYVAIHGTGATLDTTANYTLLTYDTWYQYSDPFSSTRFPLLNNTRYAMNLVNVAPSGGNPGKIQLQVSGSTASLTWVGDGSANLWDLKSSPNWTDGTPPEMFYELDSVRFDNTSSNLNVALDGALYPSSITVDNDADHNYVFSGTGSIAGMTGITKNGLGSLTIANDVANTFTGPIALNAGSLVLQQSVDVTLANTISGGGKLDKRGTNTVTLTGTNSYGGGTTIYDGILRLNASTGPAIKGDVTFIRDATPEGTYRRLYLDADDQLESTAKLHFGSDSRFFLLGHNQTLGGLDYDTGSSSLAEIANYAAGTEATLTLDVGAGETYQYRGIIRDEAGTLALVKTGPGTQYLGGNKSGQYTGGLTVQEGTLDYANGVFQGTPVIGYLPDCDYTISGGTLVTPAPVAPATSWPIKTFQITDGAVTGDGVLESNANYDIRGGEVGVVLTGSVGLDKTGTTGAVLSAANTYTGATTIDEGTLTLAAAGQIDVSSAIHNADTLVVDGGTHFLGPIDGAGTTQVNASSNVTVLSITQGSLLNDGSVTIEGGTNTIGTIDGAGTTQVNDDATLTASSITQGSLIIGGARRAPAPVPEPGVWALLLAALFSAAAWRKLYRCQ